MAKVGMFKTYRFTNRDKPRRFCRFLIFEHELAHRKSLF